MSRDHHDALIEQLLRESMGGDRPRDLTPRVMALAIAHDRTRRSWWISAGAAVAASIAIAVGIMLYLRAPGPYPPPVAENVMVYGPELTSGTKIASRDDGKRGSVRLGGGFVQLTVYPETSF